jgi:UDP-glucose 4-epimerase
MRVLVTGASGFVGSHLIARLAPRNEVFALSRSKRPSFAGDRIHWIQADLNDPLYETRLPPVVDAIVHLAQASVSFPDAAKQLYHVNTGAAVQLLHYARQARARCFVFNSTGDVYGQRRGWSDERDPADPASFYAATKHCAELLTLSYRDYLAPCVLRLFRPYGPGQTNRLIPKLTDSIRQGKPLTVPAEGCGLQTPIYIDDLVSAIVSALERSLTGIFNVAGDEVLSIRDLARLLGQVLGREPHFTAEEMPPFDQAGKNQRLKEVLAGWPTVTLNDGLRRTLCGTCLAA